MALLLIPTTGWHGQRYMFAISSTVMALLLIPTTGWHSQIVGFIDTCAPLLYAIFQREVIFLTKKEQNDGVSA